ncbi:MAG: acetate/propionate family kinase [Gaiellaceae bacterium]
MAPVLAVNAGSTSLKLSLVGEDEASEAVASLEDVPDGVVAVGHRVVHGGSRFRDPTVIDEDVERAIADLTRLAPLHNAPALAGIEKARRALPGVPHVAVFDTAFHATLPDEAAAYPVPLRWAEEWGVRRYGFHGLSVAWCAERAPELLERPSEGLRLVVCHLGGGCSITAVQDGRSVDTTMGFSPLEGVPMATRSGSVDPGALLYLLRERGLSVEELDYALNEESGLRGLSGISGSVRELEAAAGRNPRARHALHVYAHRIAGAVAAMASSLGGLDALVFTAGVGEGSARVRTDVCARLRFLGLELDPEANEAAEPDYDAAAFGSPVRVLVLRTREDVMVARAVREVLRGD